MLFHINVSLKKDLRGVKKETGQAVKFEKTPMHTLETIHSDHYSQNLCIMFVCVHGSMHVFETGLCEVKN